MNKWKRAQRARRRRREEKARQRDMVQAAIERAFDRMEVALIEHRDAWRAWRIGLIEGILEEVAKKLVRDAISAALERRQSFHVKPRTDGNRSIER